MGPKKQTEDRKNSQSKIDKHFEHGAESIEAGLAEEINKKLDLLASKDFIEQKFKEVITEKILSEAIDKLKKELFEHVKSEVNKVQQVYSDIQARMVETESDMEIIKSKVADQKVEIDKLCDEEARMKLENKKLKDLLREREHQMWVQGVEVNDLEQYSRRNNLRIYGVDDRNLREAPEETAQKLIALFRDKLELDITTKDIDIAHRMGKFSPTANRPIVCRMVARTNTLKVMHARRKCKGSQIIIREDLTRRNIKLLERVSALNCVKSAWSDNGKIVAMLQSGAKRNVDHKTDLSRLDQ